MGTWAEPAGDHHWATPLELRCCWRRAVRDVCHPSQASGSQHREVPEAPHGGEQGGVQEGAPSSEGVPVLAVLARRGWHAVALPGASRFGSEATAFDEALASECSAGTRQKNLANKLRWSSAASCKGSPNTRLEETASSK
eukprot:scaffold1016_cov258-Pinguiococcus_pyrenoidosus.AAC.4